MTPFYTYTNEVPCLSIDEVLPALRIHISLYFNHDIDIEADVVEVMRNINRSVERRLNEDDEVYEVDDTAKLS